MTRLLLRALAARRAQALAVLVLAALVVAGPVAAVLGSRAAVRDARLADLAASRLDGGLAPGPGLGGGLGYSVRGSAQIGDPAAVDERRDLLTRAGAEIGLTAVAAISRAGVMSRPSGEALEPGAGAVGPSGEPGAGTAGASRPSGEPVELGADVVARDDVCPHLRFISGGCPTTTGTGAISATAATRLGLTTGDTVALAVGGPPTPLRVAGVYEVLDPSEPYWGPTPIGNAVFASRSTVLSSGSPTVTLVVDLAPTDPARLGGDGARLRAAIAGLAGAVPLGFTVDDRLTAVADRADRTERALWTAVVAGTAPLVVVALLAVALVLGQAGAERRAESTLAVVRGVPLPPRIGLAVGPTLLVLVLAAPLGLLAGLLVAGTAAMTPSALVAAGVTTLVLAALTVAVEWRAQAGSPTRRRPWSAGLLDLVVVVLAVAAGYQTLQAPTSGGLVLLGPALLALAVGLVAGRIVLALAGASGTALLRRGRLGPALAALELARRPGVHLLVALFAVATALAGQAALGLDAVDRAVTDRARLELGADRVLHIGQTTDRRLLSAVAAADPDGRWAMAAARSESQAGPVLAVQASRLAAVATWPAGSDPTSLAAALTPASNPPVRVDGTVLTLDAAVPPGRRLTVTATMTTVDGAWVDAVFDLTGPGSRVALNGCAAGCRLAWLTLTPSGGTDVALRLYGMRQSGPDRELVSAEDFAGPGRWRTDAALVSLPDGLAVTVPATGARLSTVDAPWPLPVVLAGSPGRRGAPLTGGLNLLGATGVPVDAVATAPTLPGLGAGGLLVDYDAAARALGGRDHTLAAAEIWLAPGTPSTVVDALQAALPVAGEDSVATRAEALRRSGTGPAFDLRRRAALLGLATAVIGLIALAAAERPRRRRELTALRDQGLPTRSAARSAALGYAGLVAAGVVVGVAAGALGLAVTRSAQPVFTDGWTATAVSWSPRPTPMLGGLLAIAVGLVALAAWLGRRPASDPRSPT